LLLLFFFLIGGYERGADIDISVKVNSSFCRDTYKSSGRIKGYLLGMPQQLGDKVSFDGLGDCRGMKSMKFQNL
jgi:hypothetical protein